MMVNNEEDINKVLKHFSYEHFYVIYCKFWELDTDHDFYIDREDLLRYGNHALTYRIVDRIFSQVGLFSIQSGSAIDVRGVRGRCVRARCYWHRETL